MIYGGGMSANPHPVIFSPLEAERMARREYQNPNVLERIGKQGPEWYVRYRIKVFEMVDGRPVMARKEKFRILGTCKKMTKRQAERERDRIMSEVNGQVYSVQSHIPFESFAEVFREIHFPALKEPTRNTYDQQLNSRIIPAFKGLKLCQIDTLAIQRLMLAMEKDGIAKTTRKTVRGILSAVFSCAIQYKYLTGDNPVKGSSAGAGKSRVRECRIPSGDDIKRLLLAVDGDVATLIECLIYTGMRISEAAGLTAGAIDFERGVAKVTQRRCRGNVDDPKTESGVRVLPLGVLAETLRRRCEGRAREDYVFTFRGKPIEDNTLLANYLSPIMVKLGIKYPGFGWHAFRRFHLTVMQRDLTLFDLKTQAGHADVRTTQIYIAEDLAPRERAVRKMQQQFRGLELIRATS